MAKYILLLTWTDQGLRGVKDTVKRSEAGRAAAASAGIKILDTWWTLGPYDCVVLAEAPNDETLVAFTMTVVAQGNVKTQTMRAFDAKQFEAVLAKSR